MPLPNIDHLTTDDLRALISLASSRLEQEQRDAEQDTADRRQAIAAATAALEHLLGPENAAPGVGSIRAVAAYDDATIVEHAGLAFRLILQGMEILTSTTANIARVVGD